MSEVINHDSRRVNERKRHYNDQFSVIIIIICDKHDKRSLNVI